MNDRPIIVPRCIRAGMGRQPESDLSGVNKALTMI
jgi:hypothetical protein